MKKLPALLLLAIALVAGDALALTPDEAYAAIPHRRIAFDAGASTLTRAQADALKRLFGLSDEAVVLRVEGMRAVRSANAAEIGQVLSRYDSLVVSLRALDLPAEVASARDLIAQAVADQRRFLASKRTAAYQFVRSDLSMAPDVREASGKLHRAYEVLLKAFPNERPRNKNAFYDHLCALDYL
jgi:hypothetical protein